MPGFAQRAAMHGRGGDNAQSGGVLGHLGKGDVIVPEKLIAREPSLLANVIKAFGKHGGDWHSHMASMGRVNPETGLREFAYEPDPDPDQDYLRWAEANGMMPGAQDQAGQGWTAPTGQSGQDGFTSGMDIQGFTGQAMSGGGRPTQGEDDALLAEIMGGRQANTGPMATVGQPQTPPDTRALFGALDEDMAGNQGQDMGQGQGPSANNMLPSWMTRGSWAAPGLSQAQNMPQQLASLAMQALPGMGFRQSMAGGLGRVNEMFPGLNIQPDGGWGESNNYSSEPAGQGEPTPQNLQAMTQLGSQLTPTPQTQSQSGFTPFHRPDEMAMPHFAGLSAGMTPLQQRSALASYGTQGTNGMARSQEGQNYFKNLLMRALIGQDGQLGDINQLLPVENQYIQNVMGLQQPQNTAGLLSSFQQ